MALLLALSIWAMRDDIGHAATPRDAAVAGLPSDATDIHWFLPGAFSPNKLYDFRTSEASFRNWVEGQADRDKFRGPDAGPAIVVSYDQTARDLVKRELDDTGSYSWNEGDTGVTLVYDRVANRAYFHYHSR